jgi:hypothetical protein
LVRKILTFGIILLFLGVCIQPVFAVESDNSELEEITIQFFETDRTYNHTVFITSEQAKELENIFNNVKNSLNSTDCPIEIESFYNNAIVSMDELGLLPADMTIEYAQKLITGKMQNPIIMNFFKIWIEKKGLIESDENFMCYIAGSTGGTHFQGPIGYISWVFMQNIYNISRIFENFHKFFVSPIISFFSLIFYLFFPIIWSFKPLAFGYLIGFGQKVKWDFGYEYYPARGEVYTEGKYGTKTWEGLFFGNLPIPKFIGLFNFCFPGAIGFTGIKYRTNYIGYTLWIKIRPN